MTWWWPSPCGMPCPAPAQHALPALPWPCCTSAHMLRLVGIKICQTPKGGMKSAVVCCIIDVTFEHLCQVTALCHGLFCIEPHRLQHAQCQCPGGTSVMQHLWNVTTACHLHASCVPGSMLFCSRPALGVPLVSSRPVGGVPFISLLTQHRLSRRLLGMPL